MRRSFAILAIAAFACTIPFAGCSWLEGGPDHNYGHRLVNTKPARLDPTTLRTIRVHLHAGHKLRAQRAQWRQRMRRLLVWANAVVGPAFRIRLELASATPWQRRAGDNDLAAMVKELGGRAPGGPRDLVVGMVTPLALATPTIHLLGMAYVGGNHMVMRAGKKLPRLTAERVELVVFLHELGHLLGGRHGRNPADLMYPSVSHRMRDFDTSVPHLRELLAARLSREPKRRIAVEPASHTAKPNPRAKPPAKRESRRQAQRVDDALTEAIKSATKQRGGIALMELRAADRRMRAREARTNEEQDVLWILLARGYAKHGAVTWAEGALRKLRTPGIRAVARLKKQLDRMRRRYGLPRGGPIAAEAEAAHVRKQRRK